MIFLLLSFFAGILTVLAPCVLPLLPIIVGGSLTDSRNKYKPIIITVSLSLSVILFTLILKVSTAFISVPAVFWGIVSGGIIITFGLITLFPNLWEKISGNFTARVSRTSNTVLATGYKKKSFWGDVVMGASLGPVFSSCSPTYFVILASVLPQSFEKGVINLIAYSLGLSLSLLLIAKLGQKLVMRLNWAVDPEGWFKKTLGLLFILVGIFIIAGVDKTVQLYVLDNVYDITKIETSLLQKTSRSDLSPADQDQNSIVVEKIDNTATTSALTASSTQKTKTITIENPKKNLPRYHEIVDPGGFVNSDPVTIGQFIGKKVILLDILTYSCINCQRTFPYVVGWNEKYKDQGLQVIGIHTPEFAFEKDINNVREAMKRFGITFPVVLDNNYGTWNAYGNRYWPRKYLIDIYGNIVYDHIGEGGYDEMERHIQDALRERARVLDLSQTVTGGMVNPQDAIKTIETNSPETYFGALRNQYLANGTPGVTGNQTFTLQSVQDQDLNRLYLSGTWNIANEYAKNTSAGAKIIFKYNAKSVYFVASGGSGVAVKILRDGVPIGVEAGSDVVGGRTTIKESRLYNLINEKTAGIHTLEIDIESPGLDVYTFTFG